MTISFDCLHQIADEAAQIAMHYFNSRTISVSEKLDHSPVTQADIEIESMVRNAVRMIDSRIGILGEEFGESGDSSVRLIVDPIDGTRNFVRGIPFFATLLAVESDGDIISGLVNAPFSEERWWGMRHEVHGFARYRSRWGESELGVSHIDNLARSQLFHGSLYGCESQSTPRTLFDLASKTDRQRGVGDYYMHMLVAAGAGEIGVDFGLKPWDKAPLKAIVEGAGGRVTDVDGGFTLTSGSIISTNGKVHDRVLEIIGAPK